MAIITPVDAQSAIIDYLVDHGSELSSDIRDQLKTYATPGTSSVDASINLVELAYARKGDLPPALLSLAADTAVMATSNNFHGYRDTGRGPGIAAELLKLPGVQPSTPEAPAQAPEVNEDFLPAQPAAETPTSLPQSEPAAQPAAPSANQE